MQPEPLGTGHMIEVPVAGDGGDDEARPDNRRGRTKIVATIGPACDTAATLTMMAGAGMDVARVTLAHGSTAEAVERIRLLRRVVPQVGVLVDLPGPKVRTAPFPDGGAILRTDERVVMVADRGGPETSSAARIAVSHGPLVESLAVGDRVAFGDGGVTVVVTGFDGEGVVTRVRSGGSLLGRPGVTAPAGRLSLVTPTAEDLRRVEVMVAEQVDAI
ncbi:MAG: pyruvate kinase, partial [Actinomycetota bacterium]|nr:pyruvate kinase [Actinomycetota bacterium]